MVQRVECISGVNKEHCFSVSGISDSHSMHCSFDAENLSPAHLEIA